MEPNEREEPNERQHVRRAQLVQRVTDIIERNGEDGPFNAFGLAHLIIDALAFEVEARTPTPLPDWWPPQEQLDKEWDRVCHLERFRSTFHPGQPPELASLIIRALRFLLEERAAL